MLDLQRLLGGRFLLGADAARVRAALAAPHLLLAAGLLLGQLPLSSLLWLMGLKGGVGLLVVLFFLGAEVVPGQADLVLLPGALICPVVGVFWVGRCLVLLESGVLPGVVLKGGDLVVGLGFPLLAGEERLVVLLLHLLHDDLSELLAVVVGVEVELLDVVPRKEPLFGRLLRLPHVFLDVEGALVLGVPLALVELVAFRQFLDDAVLLLDVFIADEDGLRVLVLLVALLPALPAVYYVYCVFEALADGLLDFPEVEALVLQADQGVVAGGVGVVSGVVLVLVVLEQAVSMVFLFYLL